MQEAKCAHSGATPVTSPGNLDQPSRRGVFGSIAAAAALIPTLALASPVASRLMASTPFLRALAANDAAVARFNALPDETEFRDPGRFASEEDRLSQAWSEVTTAEPVSWTEFAQQLDVMSRGGQSGIDEDHTDHLLRQARRLLTVTVTA